MKYKQLKQENDRLKKLIDNLNSRQDCIDSFRFRECDSYGTWSLTEENGWVFWEYQRAEEDAVYFPQSAVTKEVFDKYIDIRPYLRKT